MPKNPDKQPCSIPRPSAPSPKNGAMIPFDMQGMTMIYDEIL